MFPSTSFDMPPRKSTSAALIQSQRRIFAANLKRARKAAGLTQGDVVKLTGLTQQYLSNVENGKSTISLDNANVLAAAVGQTLSQLLSPAKNN